MLPGDIPCVPADVRLPELHTMHQAKIINAFHDGIFVSLPGYEVDGLVHHSQISRQLDMDNTLPKVERFKRIQEIVGDIDYDVWVKIVYVAKTEHLKCECSLKMVRAPSLPPVPAVACICCMILDQQHVPPHSRGSWHWPHYGMLLSNAAAPRPPLRCMP